ncbi:MAG: lamin tail domain-containing protein [Chloroflexi bacterium]|nr:lamin tail domain-containing protein [Chloroflexota bacterium]
MASLTVSGSEWTQPPKEPDCTNSPVINYFNVSPMTINLGDAVTFNWSVSNAITVWLQYGEHYHGKDFNYGKFDTSPPQVSVLGSSAEPTFQKLKENNKGDTLIGFYYNLFAQCGQFVDGAQRAVALNAPSSAPPQQPPSQNQPPSSQNQPPAQSQPQQPQSQDQSQFQLSLPKVLDPKVLLNEFMPKPKAGAEYIELYNPTNLPVDISGWQLQHAVGNSAQGYVIPANTTIAARAFKLFPQSETKIALNDNGGAVQLLTADNQLADEKSYNAPQFDQAQSRSVDGGGVWTTECAATPNAANCKTTLTQSPSSSPASSSSIENIFPIALVIGAAVIGLALLAAIVIGMKKKK